MKIQGLVPPVVNAGAWDVQGFGLTEGAVNAQGAGVGELEGVRVGQGARSFREVKVGQIVGLDAGTGSDHGPEVAQGLFTWMVGQGTGLGEGV